MLDSSLLIFIQIVSESFPVSSSGHIALAVCVTTYYAMMSSAQLALFFSSSASLFLAHIPTIFMLLCFFRTTWIPLLRHIFVRWHICMHLILYAFIADSITACAYVVLKLYPYSLPLSYGFAITALMLFSLRWCRTNNTILTLRHMILLGCAQSIALLPGISRFGTVYGVCRWLGVRPSKAFGVAWMLQWPLMVAGAGIGLMEYVQGAFVAQPSLSALFFATGIAYGGLYSMYVAAQKNLLWLLSIYMLIPFIISYILHC